MIYLGDKPIGINKFIESPYAEWVRPATWPDLDSIDYTDFDGYYLTYDLGQPCEDPKISICVATTDNGPYLAERGTLSNGVFTAMETYENDHNAEFHHDLDIADGTIQLWRVTAKTGKVKVGIFSAINNKRVAGYQPCVEKYQRTEMLNENINTMDIIYSGASRPAVCTYFMQHDRWMGTMLNQQNLQFAWRYAQNLRLVDFRDAAFTNSNFTAFSQSFNSTYGAKCKFDSSGASFPNVTSLQLAFNNNALWSINCSGFINATSLGRFQEYSYGCIEFVPPPVISSDGFTVRSWSMLNRASLLRIIEALESTTTTKALYLGATNLNKLTAEEIAVGTEKGWTIAA